MRFRLSLLAALFSIVGVALLCRADVPPNVGQLSGTITKDDNPAAGIMIRIVKVDDPSSQPSDGKVKPKGDQFTNTVKQFPTDNTGKFSVLLPAGKYQIIAGISGGYTGRGKASVVVGQTIEVKIALKPPHVKKS